VKDPFVYFAAIQPLKPNEFASRLLVRKQLEETTLMLKTNEQLWHYVTTSQVTISNDKEEEEEIKITFAGEEMNDGSYTKKNYRAFKIEL
jgi:hypothetical protein